MGRASKIPIVLLIGGGSKLPPIIKESKKTNSKFFISLVVSHKRESVGVKIALENKIPAIYFRLTDYRKKIAKNEKSARKEYMEKLGWFISQNPYTPKLIVFAGWDLIMDKTFFKFFKSKFGNGYCAINLHPALLPTQGEKNSIKLPDESTSSIIKGEQEEVLNTVIKKKVTYFGPTVHFMVPDKYDTGKVIRREFIKVGKKDTIESLKKKLKPVEDKILAESINSVITNIDK